MITRRKNEQLPNKSKDKTKTLKESKDPKKKKDPAEKTDRLRPSASKKLVKPIIHVNHRPNEEADEQNENINKSNLPSHAGTVLIKNRHEAELISIRRSASMGGLKVARPVRKSLSPALSKEKDRSDIKHKYSSKPSSRSDREKEHIRGLDRCKSTMLKKNPEKVEKEEKQKIVRKKSEKHIKNSSQRLKTDSSKMPQVKQKQEKTERVLVKKKPKQTKPKPILKSESEKEKERSKTKVTIKPKGSLKNSVVFSDVSFHDTSPLYSAIMPKENFEIKMEKQENRILNACITIQKHFRGYLTRKYIEETKYMLYSVIKIQKVWRGYCCRRKLKRESLTKKNLSIENSLITIKDFSDDPKNDRHRHKIIKFQFESSEKKKEDNSSIKKNWKDESEEKYINILQSLLMEDELDEKYKDKIRSTLGKEKYVQQKINSQIISEKSFNSPRELRSPKSSLVMKSPSSWSKNRPIDSLDHCSSPRNADVSSALSKRMSSPSLNKSGLNSSRRLNTEQKIDLRQELKPIQTNFVFIEEFELRIVDYLRDNADIKENFLDTCQKCQNFRNYLVMSQWNIERDYRTDYFTFLQDDICPDIFPTSFREEVIQENSMKIYLEDNNYLESLWVSNSAQRAIYEGYLKCIFDSLAQAIFDSYRFEIVTRKSKNAICHFGDHELFKLIFMNSLTLMQGWNEYMCGAEIPVEETDPNFKTYCDNNKERMEIMVRNSLLANDFKQHGAVTFWVELAISDAIFESLVQQLRDQFFV